jgi:hypothetical protein
VIAVWIRHQAFAVFFDVQSARERAKLSVSEQKARIAWMTYRSLVNEKRVGNQNAAGPERALKVREQRAV